MTLRYTKRRDFLKFFASASTVGGLTYAFPPAIRKALAIDAAKVTGTIQDVKHVVMVMLENRSFDEYFGTFKGARGFGDRFAIPVPNGRNNLFQSYTATNSVYIPFHLDQTQGNAQRAGGTPHTWTNAQAAWDHGRMARWPDAKTDLSMGYLNTAEVPFQRALADAFTLCDQYHCGMHTGTIANRLFYWTGTNGPNGISPDTGVRTGVAALDNRYNGGNDIGPSTEGWTWTTYADHLEKAGVSWKVYQSLIDNFGCNEMMGFRHWRKAIENMPEERRPKYVGPETLAQDINLAGVFYDPAIDDALSPLAKGFGNTMPDGLLTTFKADIANGTLPEVSWIVPPSAYSEHPSPSSPVQGAWYVQEVLDALTANPEVWSKTVLLVNFDENDGFFDHVPTPCAPSYDDNGARMGDCTLPVEDYAVEYYNYPRLPDDQPTQYLGRPFGPGPRVPMWIISPWSRGGWMNSQVFDHTSILMFLEKRFGVKEPQISAYRRLACGDLTSCFNFANPNDEAIPTLEGHKTKPQADDLRTAQEAAATLPRPTASLDTKLPSQEPGSRPSRALPYELHTTSHTDNKSQTVQLEFVNSSQGNVGAVFHVYDKLHLDRIPRRYAIEAGKDLSGTWDVSADLGKYDLWVLGPNGYHREYIGDLREFNEEQNPEIQICYVPCDDTQLVVKLHNKTSRPCTFTAQANAYRNKGPWEQRVAAHAVGEFTWNVNDTGNWYDFTIECDLLPTFKRRLAGRIENGKDLVSDPSLGGE